MFVRPESALLASSVQVGKDSETNAITSFTTQGSSVVTLFPIEAHRAESAVIVVPCYNEAERLDLPAFSTFLQKVQGVRFVFVNDGSRDATLSVPNTLHAAHPDRVEVVSISRNSGEAEAARRYLDYAAASGVDFVSYWDADLATPHDAVVGFLRLGQR